MLTTTETISECFTTNASCSSPSVAYLPQGNTHGWTEQSTWVCQENASVPANPEPAALTRCTRGLVHSQWNSAWYTHGAPISWCSSEPGVPAARYTHRAPGAGAGALTARR